MKTVIKLMRTNPTDARNVFYYLCIYTQDSLGIIHAQTSTIISAEQYTNLKGIKEEIYQNDNYQVDLA